MFDRLHRENRTEAPALEGQIAHVGDDRLAVLASEGRRIDVDAHRLARREQMVAVSDPAAKVEQPPRPEKGSESA